MSIKELVKTKLLGKKDENSLNDSLKVYMDPEEYSQVLAVLEVLEPENVLEWGSGGSTKALLERFSCIKNYISLEHNKNWFNKVKNIINDDRLQIFHQGPNVEEPDMFDDKKKYKEWMTLCEEDYTVMKEYVEFPSTLGITYDFILVDGRARVHCLKSGWELLNSGGVIMIHDAQRKEYHETLNSLGRAVFLEPYGNGQICFIKKR